MTTPRYLLVDPHTPLCYHLVSKCVRKSWLCGIDRLSRKDYSHRKQWFVDRLHQLGQAFAVDIYAYAVMSNHFHLVVYYDPQAPDGWSNAEVVQRWLKACPPKRSDGQLDEARLALYTQTLQSDPTQVAELRSKLGSLSLFMKFLKQPIARRANLEDNCSGHFFEQRFYSGALLSEDAVVAAMAYVDLNPVRAKIAKTIAEAEYTSVAARLKTVTPHELKQLIGPIICGVGQSLPLNLSLADYLARLEALTPSATGSAPHEDSKVRRWRDQVATLKKRQRAFGPINQLSIWVQQRGWQMREAPMP